MIENGQKRDLDMWIIDYSSDWKGKNKSVRGVLEKTTWRGMKSIVLWCKV